MKKNIISLSELFNSGKKIAFIKGNRLVNNKNVKSKKASFEKFNMNLIPLMYVSGEKAIADGCTLIDAKTDSTAILILFSKSALIFLPINGKQTS